MRGFSLLAALGLLAMASGHQEDDGHGKQSDKLIELTADIFDRDVVDPKSNKLVNGPWFIMFYAPWCGHCKRMMPLIDEFAEKYGDGQRLNVGRFNCDEGNNSNLCTAYDVNGFPTVLYLSGGYFYEFRGPRTIENFSKFVFEGEYENAESDVLPVKLEGVALYQKQFMKFMGQLGRSVEILFARLGFKDLPKPVMYLIASSIFLIPLSLMCYVICCMKDENVYEPQGKPAVSAGEKVPRANNSGAKPANSPADKAGDKKRREKIE